jgi:hypothetical protein
MFDQIADLFRTTHKVKTQQVIKSRGQHCGDIELAGYLANAAGPLQEFSLRKPTVTSSTSSARLFLPSSKAGLD